MTEHQEAVVFPLGNDVVEAIKQTKKENPTWGSIKISRHLQKLGVIVSDRTVRVYLKNVYNHVHKCIQNVEFDEKKDALTISGKTRCSTLDEFLKEHNVDLNKWEVERHILNRWEMGSSTDEGTETTPLFQIKVWLKPRQSVNIKESYEEILEELKSPNIKTFKYKEGSGLLEICPFDLHFAKLCWKPETGENYDTIIAEQRLMSAIDDIILKTKHLKIDRILYPIGNDYFHADNAMNQTFSGTPQDVDGRWQKVFNSGTALLIQSIERLRQVAPVDIIVINGNHDKTLCYYAGVAIKAYFRNDKNVHVNNTPSPRKYYRYFNNLIGLTHGDKEKIKELPLIMAQEARLDWADTDYREWHIGHLHHKRQYQTQNIHEEKGVTIRQIRSLTGTDSWHNEKGYVSNIQSLESFFWDKERGIIAQFNHNL